jgi:hypothetical protein
MYAGRPRSQQPGVVGLGGPARPADGVLLVYAASDHALDALRSAMIDSLARHGHAVVAITRLRPLPSRDAPREAKREPFGFVDGISQPLMR